MRIKSYFSQTVEDAMAKARRELGAEAMLMNSRRTPVESRHLGDYEVVFATDVPEEETGQSAAGGCAAARASVSTSPSGRLSEELADLKRELANMRRMISRTAFAPQQWAGSLPGASEAYALLAAAEVAPELASSIVRNAESRMARSGGTLYTAVEEELRSRITTQPELGRDSARPRVVALVGPPGAGKTTTLVKLAVNYGLACRRPVLLLSTDTYRVAAADQLRSYAAILGVGCQVLDTVTALAQALEESRNKDLILIDTPGLGLTDMESASLLARFLSSRGDIDTHLAVPASMKSADLARVVDAFAIFHPQRLLFTRLDETSLFGPILNEAARASKPLSFFTTGQRIPEDLEEATPGRLARLILPEMREGALSAA